MDGAALDSCMDRGFFGTSKLKRLIYPAGLSTKPTNYLAATAAGAVSEQCHVVDARFVDASGTLQISELTTPAGAPAPAGPGRMIPYIGNVRGPAAAPAARSIGTYSSIFDAHLPFTWVVTGPFSGCYAAVFRCGQNWVFAHIATPAQNTPCPTARAQSDAIKQALATASGAPVGTVHAEQIAHLQMHSGKGAGWAFWTYFDNAWHFRLVVMQGDQPTGARGGRTGTQFVVWSVDHVHARETIRSTI